MKDQNRGRPWDSIPLHHHHHPKVCPNQVTTSPATKQNFPLSCGCSFSCGCFPITPFLSNSGTGFSVTAQTNVPAGQHLHSGPSLPARLELALVTEGQGATGHHHCPLRAMAGFKGAPHMGRSSPGLCHQSQQF